MKAMLTHRRDQLGFRRAEHPLPCGNTLIGGIIFCGSAQGREGWVRRLNKLHPNRFNYFVYFRDIQSPFALQFGFAEWASLDHPYIDY